MDDVLLRRVDGMTKAMLKAIRERSWAAPYDENVQQQLLAIPGLRPHIVDRVMSTLRMKLQNRKRSRQEMQTHQEDSAQEATTPAAPPRAAAPEAPQQQTKHGLLNA